MRLLCLDVKKQSLSARRIHSNLLYTITLEVPDESQLTLSNTSKQKV